MQVSSFEFLALISGLAYFSLGLAVFARAVAYPQSNFRQRLVALGAFGLLQTGAICVSFISSILLPSDLRILLSVPSFLALYYFAFGWNEERPGLANGLALGTLAVLLIFLIGISDTTYLPLAIRCGVALPASACAAFVFVRDKAFKLDAGAPNFPGRFAAAGFALYGLLQIFSDPTAISVVAGIAG